MASNQDSSNITPERQVNKVIGHNCATFVRFYIKTLTLVTDDAFCTFVNDFNSKLIHTLDEKQSLNDFQRKHCIFRHNAHYFNGSQNDEEFYASFQEDIANWKKARDDLFLNSSELTFYQKQLIYIASNQVNLILKIVKFVTKHHREISSEQIE